MADVFGEVQPHECEARNDNGPRHMPQPIGLDRLNMPATHAARPTAANMVSGAVATMLRVTTTAVQQ
jgi:hypothetical protein